LQCFGSVRYEFPSCDASSLAVDIRTLPEDSDDIQGTGGLALGTNRDSSSSTVVRQDLSSGSVKFSKVTTWSTECKV